MRGSQSARKAGGHYTTLLLYGEIAVPGFLYRGNLNNHFLPGGIFSVGTWERMLLTQLKSHRFFFLVLSSVTMPISTFPVVTNCPESLLGKA